MPRRNFSADPSEHRVHGTLSTLLGIDTVEPAETTARLSQFSDSLAQLWLLLIPAHLIGLFVVSGGATISIFAAHPEYAAGVGLVLAADLWVAFAPRAAWRFNLWRGYIFMAQIAGVLLASLAFRITAFGTADAVGGDHHLAIMAQAGVALVAFAVLAGNRLMLMLYAAAVAVAMLLLAPASPFTLGGIAFLPLAIAAIMISRRREAALEQQVKLDRQEVERAAVLLGAYEDTGDGMFWETDRSGKIRYISPVVAKRFGAERGLNGQLLTSLVVSNQDESATETRTLGFHLSARSSFRDLAVRLRVPGDEQWWSISGNPIHNELGHFLGFRGHGSDLTAMKRSEQENTQLARYDALTGLANRLHIKQLFEKSLTTHSGHSQPCSLFLIDLDKFKQVNDTLGHPVGDLLLQQVARRLERVIGDRGQVGRLGGDEFQVILPQMVNTEKLAELAGEVIAVLSRTYFLDTHQVTIGASVGIAVFDRGEPDSAALIRNADLALYAAKAAGRGIYRFYETDMHRLAAERRKIEQELRTALGNDEFKIVYQPVVNVSTEKISGFEALIRWDHPRLGQCSPAKFIPVAEEGGMIIAIGEWVLRHACAQAVQWPRPARVAVNVSPIQFTDPSFVSTLISVLAHSGLAPDRLELEITEGIFLNESQDTFSTFKKLKEIGVRLVLDDFGTGYSALGYLKKAPFDKIKIDQSFVRGASEPGSVNSAIITSIVNLAEALGMETTAEGAETHEELERVRSLGCSHLQGFIYGRPMSTEDASAMLGRNNGFAVAEGFAKSREKRISILRKAALFHNDYCYQGRIRNLSDHGALIEGLWDVPAGTRFAVQLDRELTVEATTRWSSENRMGLCFDQPIDAQKVARAPKLDVAEGPLTRRKAG